MAAYLVSDPRSEMELGEFYTLSINHGSLQMLAVCLLWLQAKQNQQVFKF